MSQVDEPASDAESRPYIDDFMTCGHCDFLLEPTYRQAFHLTLQQPINCSRCSSDVLLNAVDRKLLGKKFQRAARLSKVTATIWSAFFMISVYLTLTGWPFTGASGLWVGLGIIIYFVLKSFLYDSREYDFVLFRHNEDPNATDVP